MFHKLNNNWCINRNTRKAHQRNKLKEKKGIKKGSKITHLKVKIISTLIKIHKLSVKRQL